MGFQQQLAKGKQNEQINDYLNPFKSDALNDRYHYAVRTLAKTGNTNYEQIVNDAYEATRLYGKTVAQSVGAGVNDAMTNLQAAQTEMDKYLKLTGYGYSVQGKTEEEIGELYNRNVKAPRTNWMQNYMTTPYNGIEWEKQATGNAMTTKILADLPGYLTKMAAGHGLENGPDLSEEEIMHMSKLSYLLPADAKGVYRRLLNNHNYVIDDDDKNILENARKAISEQLGLPAEYIPFELDDYGAYIEDYYRKNTLMGAQAWFDAEPDNEEADRNLWFLQRKQEYSQIPQAEDFAEKSKAIQKELGVFRTDDESKYAYINDLSNQRFISGLNAGRGGVEDPLRKYYFMEPEEVGIYNYLHAQEDGQKKADEYLQYLEYDLYDRMNTEDAQRLYEFSGKNGWNAAFASGASIIGSLERGVGFLDALSQRLFGGDKPINYGRAGRAGITTDAIRQGVMDSVDWKLNIGGREYDAFDFLYSTGMSWLDSKAAGTMFGPTGAGVALGLSAAESTFRAAKDKGAGVDEALIASTFAGVFEGLFEKFSLGELQKAAKGARGQNFFKNLGWQGLVNASEELNTDLANMYIDNFLLGDLSDYNLAVEEYKRLGMDAKEAETKARQDIYLQLAETALGGGLMGGVSAVYSSSISAANTASSNKQAGKAIIAHGTTQVLNDLADKLGDDTKAGKRLKKLAEKYDPKKATNRQTGRLYREVINALPQQMRAPLNERMMLDIDQKLKALGETGDTAKTADAIRAMLAGEKISEEQSQAIAQSEHGLDVAKDLLGMNEAAAENVEQASEEDYPSWEDNAADANAQAAPAQEQNANDQTQADLQDKYDKEVASHNQTKEDLNAMTTLQGETKAELDAKTEEYNQALTDLETANKNIQTLENTISGMEKDLADLDAQLDKQEELSEQELQKVQADKAAIESELAIAQASLNGMTAERDELAGRVTTLEGEKTALQDKYDKEVASHNQTKADLADAQTAHANTQADLDKKTDELKETQTALNKTEADLKVTQAALNRANSTVKANRVTIEAIHKEQERLQAKLADQEALSEQERQEAQAEMDRLKSELAIAETELATSEQEYADLKEKFNTLQTDKDNLERQLAGKQLEIKILRAQMGAVAKAFETTQSLLRTKNEELNATQDALDKANTTIAENEASIQAATKEIETLQSKLDSQEVLSEQERQEAQAKIDELNADIDTYNTLLSQAQTDKTNLEGQIEILEKEQAELEGQIETLKTDNANLQAQNSSLQTDNDNLEAQNSSLQNDNANLQAQLDKQTELTAAAEAEAAALQKELDAVKKLIPDYRVGDDGEIVVNENGKAVPLEESSLSEDEQTIITEMSDADPAITQAAVNAYSYLGSLFSKGKNQPAEVQQKATEQPADEGMQDAKSFAKGFKRAVEWAKAGKNIMDSASPFVAELHEAVKKYAQQYGEALRQEELRKQEQENIQQAHDNGFQTLQENGENVGVSFVQVTQNIGGNTKIQLKLIDMIARKRGLRVHVYDSLNDGKANGKFQKDTNLISVALDTEGGLLTRVVSHEIYHYIENWNKRDAKRIKDYVLNTLQNKEGYDLQKAIDAKIKDYAKNGKTLTVDEAKSEIVADSMLDVIGTEENLKQLMKQDRTLVEKISVELKKIVADLKAMMQRLSGSSAEVKALQGDMDYYSNILQMVDEALAGAKENYAAAQYKSAPAMQDSAVQEYLSDMKGAVTQEDSNAALNGLVSNLFVRAEKGWMAKNMDANLDEAMQNFADALKSYQRGEMALENALKREGFDAQPYEMNTVLSYAGQQLLRAEARGLDGDVQYLIKQYTKNGHTYSYVQADRQVIHGDDPQAWGAQITDYINEKIRHGKDVTVYSENGVPLTITKDTAGKAAFWNTDRSGNPVSEADYALKLRIETHIDEAAQVSIGKGPKANDKKTHSIARGGWNYRRAYFEDFDGKYYSFQISVGSNGKINTIYNVNEIKQEAVTPNTLKGAQPQKATVGGNASSGGIVADESLSVKKNLQAEKVLNQNGIELLNDDTATMNYSFKTYTKNERTRMLDALVEAGFERESAEKWLEDLDSVSAKIGADPKRLDFLAADNHTMLKENSEYKYTVDASTLCKKRLLYQGTFDAIQHRLPKRMISSDELLDLLNVMKEMGYETPCGICYVESMRRHLGRYAQRWLDGYQGKYIPSLDEVTTSDGLEKLRHDHPQTYDDFIKAMKKLGTANPKVVQLRTEYNGEIGKISKRVIDYLNEHGGLRVQSYSDFEVYHALDMMQVFVDMAAKGLKSQAYTKVPEYARIFGKTGQKINLSLIAEGSGLDENGNLIFSSTEGMDFETALEIRKNNSANVGTIIVGTSKEHILKCMADDRIDYIIPFHRSGWGQHEMEMMGIGMYDDFTKWQNEKYIDTGKNVDKNYDPIEYWDFSKSGKENAEAYLKKCAAEGRIPKFSNFLVNNGDGSYSLQPDGSTDGYWKTLIDFKMYDNSGKGSPQVAVKPNFNMHEVMRILNEATGTADTLPVAQDVVDRFVEMLESKEQYSFKKSDIAKSVEEDAALFTQVKSDSDIADAVALVRRLCNTPAKEYGTRRDRRPEIADRLLSETGSKYNRAKLIRKLGILYTAMDNGADSGEIMTYVRGIAMALLEETPGMTNEMDENTLEALRVLKNTRIYFTDTMQSAIRETMGSLKSYKLKNGARLEIRQKATEKNSGAKVSLKDIWVDILNPLRPDVFALDAKEADMPIILDAFLETANAKTYSSIFGENLEQYATDMALTILLEYYDMPGLAGQGQRLRDELRAKQQQIRTEYKQKYEQRMKGKQNTEAKQKLRKKIIRVVRSMYSKLHTDSDNKHVPQALKGAVSAMIRPFLDETGVFTGPELRAILQEYSMLAVGGKNQDIAAAYAYDPDIQAKIEKVAQTMDGRKLSQLTLEELTDLRDIVGNLNKIIAEQNMIQLKGRKMTLWELGSRAIGEQKMKKTLGPKAEKIMNALYINMTPIYYFKRLGGVFVELWDEVRKGQTKYIFNVKKAKKYIEEQIRKYNVKSWYHKENLKFTTQEGDEIELTMGNCLYLCATWKRELTNKMQDAAHLRIGGFVYAKTDANGKLKVDRAHPHAIGQADMNRIMEYMGEEAVNFVDETVGYLSKDMAALGNETSMERYGYEKFGESYYFPYKVDSDYTETNLNRSKDETPSSLFSWGASKKTTERANKPVLLGDYMETWANHVNEMCVYNGFATAVDNMNRVYNFVTPSIVTRDADGNIIKKLKTESLRAEIARAHGKGADKYLADITKSIAGGNIGHTEETALLRKSLSKFRKNAVVLSASVAIQQPSSIMRAMAHISPKYFVGKIHSPRKSYEEMMQYSGTANVKAMGKFDIGMGQSAQQWMLDDLGSGSKLKDLGGKADDIMGKAPEVMDQLTWASLWEAVKREQRAMNPMMDHTSEAFLQKCGERFDEVVDLTQVYDSVLSRSKIMRSKDGWAQMITSFMAEPTLTTNMLMDALLNFKENKSTRNHVTVKRAAAVYAASVFVNALLQSIVTAARDDDEEKTYLEKYLAEFTENFMDDINPLGNIPIIQDILGLTNGYDVVRTDMALFSDLVGAVEKWRDENKTIEEKVEASAKAIGALFGIPVKNAIREVETIGNLIYGKPISETSGVNIKYSILEALPYTGLESGKVTPYYERMMEALMDGDKAQYTELESYVTGTMQKDEKDIRKGLKSALKESLLDGKTTSSEAQRFLQKYCDMGSDDAYFQVDEWLENEAHKNEFGDEEYSYSRYNGVYEAVKAGKSIEGASRELLAYGYTDKDISNNVKAKIGDWYISGEMSKSEAERALAKYTGEKTKDINSQMLRWTYVKQKGFKESADVYKSFFQAVETGDNLRTIIREMTRYGYEKSDLASRITSQYKDKYITLYRTNRVAATNLKARLLTAYAALGYDRTKKSKDIDAWLKEN